MTVLARRELLRGLASTPLATLPLAAILADARLARAAADTLETVEIATAGGKSVSAAIALPEVTPAPAVLLVHEWWGLNDQIKSVAAELAREGYVALAVDLYGGHVAENADQAKAYMGQVVAEEATDTLVSWITWLRAHDAVGQSLGTVGWCFGGGWALSAAVAAPVEATVVYYGRVNHGAEELAKLKGPVLGHFATEDGWITEDMVSGFEATMDSIGKPYDSYWYEAQHAFANPSGGRYDEEDAKLAWERTLAFFQAHLTRGA